MNYEKFMARCVKIYNGQSMPNVVRINDDRIAALAPEIQVTDEEASWDFYLPESLQVHQGADPELLKNVAYYFFVMLSLQYRFWDKDDQGDLQHWHYKSDPKLKGSAGLAQLMMDRYHAGTFPGFHLQDLDTLSEYTDLFRGVGIPAYTSRALILASLADYDYFVQDVYPKFIQGMKFDVTTAYEMSQLYRDAYGDPYLKKIQLFLGIIAANFRARGLKVETSLTAYSDYRLPQVLRHLGVLEYEGLFAYLVGHQHLLNKGGPLEEAIRAATVLACEKLAQAAGVRSADVDCYLFLKTRDPNFMKGIEPFHLVATTHY